VEKMSVAEIGTYIAAILTLMVFSLPLYKDNPLFRIAESLLIGVSVGYSFVIAVRTISDKAWKPMLAGNAINIIPIILGILLYTRYYGKTAYLSRWPLALILGVGTGIAIKGVIEAQIYSQVVATMLPLTARSPLETLNNWIMIIGTIVSLSYFLFTERYSRYFGKSTMIGRWFLMIMFGALFGNMALTRMTWLLGRFDFLLRTFGIIK
jgi:hypothetical protein